MPENLRALIVVLVISTIIFSFIKQGIRSIINEQDFTRRRNLWFALTIVAFAANNFWIYSCIAIPLLLFYSRRESNPLALFFFLLFILPTGTVSIPGFGSINYIIQISNYRILVAIILLPVYLLIRRQGANHLLDTTLAEKLLVAYLLVSGALFFRESSITNAFREALYLFIDIYVPYFVIRHSLKNLRSFRDVLFSFVIAVMAMASIAVFEFVKHWLLYSSLTSFFDSASNNYLGRSGMLRAIVTSNQPIVLGYLMVVGMGFYLYLQSFIQKKTYRWLGMTVLAAGLIAPLSRGPWIGAAIMIIVFVATGRGAISRLLGLAMVVIFTFAVIAELPGGEKVINLLPYIGTTEKGNIVYREQLITNSVIVIKRYPFFGSEDYLDTPEMQSMVQGQGIIDIVNSYIGVALNKGLIGLGLFVGFFVLTLLGIFRAMRSIQDKDSEEFILGRTLLASLLAIMVMIFTVSSISFIPIVYWCVAGLGTAFVQMIKKQRETLKNGWMVGQDQKNIHIKA